MFIRTVLLLMPILLACARGSAAPQRGRSLPIDQVPMYGGMDRQSVPELRRADEALIAGASASFGSREKAAVAWAEQGFRFYKANENDKAMRRFNQAWLLDPKCPDVYWGFGS